MMNEIASVGVWFQQTVTLPDTLLMRQVGSTPTAFERIASIASGLMSIALLVFTVAAVPAAWNFRKSYKKVNDLLARVYSDVTPLMRHASTIADNIDYITTSIRADVQQVNDTIASANERLRSAMAITERRLHEFNALLAVVQEEAEGVFVSTASTVRGVKTGAAAFRDGVGPDLARDEGDLEADEADLLNDVEDLHGDDSISEASALGGPSSERRGPTRPRVRRGSGRRQG
jgi:uncharacterized protein YoxC